MDEAVSILRFAAAGVELSKNVIPPVSGAQTVGSSKNMSKQQ